MKFEMYLPVNPWFITQKFGETANLEYYLKNGVSFTGHNGMDLVAKHGEPVYASHAGVVEVQVDTKQGHGVVITTKDTFEDKGEQVYFKSIYWHLIDNIPVKTGQEVKAGDLVGYADSTGLSTGDHLHFGLKRLKKDANGFYNLDQNNGYMGAIDPAPYLNGIFASSLSKFKFTYDLEWGQRDRAVLELQKALKGKGYLPENHVCTDFYGDITRRAVYNFQLENLVNLSWWARFVHRGRYFSTQTREALNKVL